ncbi:Protein kinase domain [Carpediemonas membranifera]|uniref:Protein kinase domain n=1 Tax=Carpediemonas membranifera TaxID=201153 RepID=A0A8J6B3E8_9EUKA|nr:Protein kinase domain [Carpediemonas membranifera]|eukprot:KAG9393454.1 Protein kinase domain [Carpediemonas membranifera]
MRKQQSKHREAAVIAFDATSQTQMNRITEHSNWLVHSTGLPKTLPAIVVAYHSGSTQRAVTTAEAALFAHSHGYMFMEVPYKDTDAAMRSFRVLTRHLLYNRLAQQLPRKVDSEMAWFDQYQTKSTQTVKKQVEAILAADGERFSTLQIHLEGLKLKPLRLCHLQEMLNYILSRPTLPASFYFFVHKPKAIIQLQGGRFKIAREHYDTSSPDKSVVQTIQGANAVLDCIGRLRSRESLADATIDLSTYEYLNEAVLVRVLAELPADRALPNQLILPLHTANCRVEITPDNCSIRGLLPRQPALTRSIIKIFQFLTRHANFYEWLRSPITADHNFNFSLRSEYDDFDPWFFYHLSLLGSKILTTYAVSGVLPTSIGLRHDEAVARCRVDPDVSHKARFYGGNACQRFQPILDTFNYILDRLDLMKDNSALEPVAGEGLQLGRLELGILMNHFSSVKGPIPEDFSVSLYNPIGNVCFQDRFFFTDQQYFESTLIEVNTALTKRYFDEFLRSPVTPQSVYVLAPPTSVAWPLASVEPLLDHIVSSGTIPNKLSLTADGSDGLPVVIMMTGMQFMAEPADPPIAALLTEKTMKLQESIIARMHREREDERKAEASEAQKMKEAMAQLLTSSAAYHLAPIREAVQYSEKFARSPLMHHPPRPFSLPPGLAPTSVLEDRLSVAWRLTPAKRLEVVQAVATAAELATKAFTKAQESTKACDAYAQFIVTNTSAADVPTPEEVAKLSQILDNAEKATMVPELEDLRPELLARFSELKAFLDTKAYERFALAQRRLSVARDDSIALEAKRYESILSEARAYLAIISKVKDTLSQCRGIAHIENLLPKYYDLCRQTEFSRRNADAIRRKKAAEHDIRTLQRLLEPILPFAHLCPELEGILVYPAQFRILSIMGLESMLDLPESRNCRVFSDFPDVEAVGVGRNSVFLTSFRGKRLLAKSFTLDSDELDNNKHCLQEATILSRLSPSGIVPKLHYILFDVHPGPRSHNALHYRGRCLLVMEFIQDPFWDGTCSTRSVISRFGALFRALAKLHAAGFAHGDLKPENVRMRGSEAVLIDFETLDHEGTQMYNAPEEMGLPSRAGLTLARKQACDVCHAGYTVYALTLNRRALRTFNFSQLSSESTVMTSALLVNVFEVSPKFYRLLLHTVCANPLQRLSAAKAFSVHQLEAQRDSLSPTQIMRYHWTAKLRTPVKRVACNCGLPQQRADTLTGLLTVLSEQGSSEDHLFSFNGASMNSTLSDLYLLTEHAFVGNQPLFRAGTLVFAPGILDLELAELRPLLVGLGRVLQLMLLNDIAMPAHMASSAWFRALKGEGVDLEALMPELHWAMVSLAAAREACPLAGFVAVGLDEYRDEVRRRFAERMKVVREGMEKNLGDDTLAALRALSVDDLRAMLTEPSPRTVDDVLGLLTFDDRTADMQAVLRTALEDDETRHRFEHVFFSHGTPESRAHIVFGDHVHDRLYSTLTDVGDIAIHIPAGLAGVSLIRAIHRTARGIPLDLVQRIRRNALISSLDPTLNVPSVRQCPWCGRIISLPAAILYSTSETITQCACANSFCVRCLRSPGATASRHGRERCEIHPPQSYSGAKTSVPVLFAACYRMVLSAPYVLPPIESKLIESYPRCQNQEEPFPPRAPALHPTADLLAMLLDMPSLCHSSQTHVDAVVQALLCEETRGMSQEVLIGPLASEEAARRISPMCLSRPSFGWALSCGRLYFTGRLPPSITNTLMVNSKLVYGLQWIVPNSVTHFWCDYHFVTMAYEINHYTVCWSERFKRFKLPFSAVACDETGSIFQSVEGDCFRVIGKRRGRAKTRLVKEKNAAPIPLVAVR